MRKIKTLEFFEHKKPETKLSRKLKVAICVSFRAKEEDLTEIEKSGCLYQAGVDRQGRPVIVFIGKFAVFLALIVCFSFSYRFTF